MRLLLSFTVVTLMASWASAGERIVLPQPTNPACLPTPTPPRPTPQPTPKPTPRPDVSPTPRPTPKPTPTPPPRPTPPAVLDPEEPEPESLGSIILDKALKGEGARGILPLWINYPWRPVPHQKAWTAFLVETLRKDGRPLLETVPADIQLYCPKYEGLSEEERLVFWTRFISVLAEHESSYNPLTVFWEPKIGRTVFSTGLLMLSIVSAKSDVYNCTMIKTQDDLFQWRKNLACSVRVMSSLMKRDGAIAYNPNSKSPKSFHGLARYWQPLRDARMKSPIGRMCLNELIQLRLPRWSQESVSKLHPNYHDTAYKKAGEKKSEQFLRLVNQIPFCR